VVGEKKEKAVFFKKKIQKRQKEAFFRENSCVTSRLWKDTLSQ
jgi:hypothetical protein